MQKKLTLSIEAELVDFAHEYARTINDSISHLISTYLGQLRRKNKTLPVGYIPKDPLVRKLAGCLKDPSLSSDKKTLRKMAQEKHG
jgi:hypothetical protein